ncbi:V-type proton ATPase subunit S1-like [Conger conger]|uniref:V-type proton ATPase subunit S1-like n=1 Tax=Conger conger TaxID=82655 RepID=UPI002A5A1071|nr:V-type proton ATPase subunit S1-like [Conger conger]
MAVLWLSTAPMVMAFLLFLSAILSSGSCRDQVPLLLWSSEGFPLPQQSPPAVGNVVSAAQLESYLSTALPAAPPNTLLFLQDELSVDDFTVFGGIFGNKQDGVFPHLEAALRVSQAPLVLPALSLGGSSAVLPLLQQHLGTPPLYLDPSSLAQLRLNASVPALLVIHLPYKPGAGLMSPRDALRGNDAVIGQVLDVMKAQAVPYTAIYTALKPSRVALDLSESAQSIGRTLLQAAPTNTTAPLEYRENGTVCILLWADSLSVNLGNATRDLWNATFGPDRTIRLDDSFCNSTNGTEAEARLVIDYGDIMGSHDFILTFNMARRMYPVSGRYWFTLDTVRLEYGNETAVFNGGRNIYAPAEYSYHCASVSSVSDRLLEPSDSGSNASSWQVSFTNFQIQGFGIVAGNSTQFSYANDCASFFTPGIWMGLLISLLMLLILTYGLHMITQLRTMDRFDDPKGPSIAVPQSE